MWFRLHEKGGKRHEVPSHHIAEDYLDAYLDAEQIKPTHQTHVRQAESLVFKIEVVVQRFAHPTLEFQALSLPVAMNVERATHLDRAEHCHQAVVGHALFLPDALNQLLLVGELGQVEDLTITFGGDQFALLLQPFGEPGTMPQIVFQQDPLSIHPLMNPFDMRHSKQTSTQSYPIESANHP